MPGIRIALIGVGKIARDQHVPALAGNADFELVAGVSRHQKLDGVPNYRTLADLLLAQPDVDAVSICTPPQVRYGIAHDALQNGLHVMLEKPPGATLNEVEALREVADAARSSLYASWHSRAAAGVEPARHLLAERGVLSVTVEWKEDVRVWHPGQAWIWQAGGLGVFDPGINALSILTAILPGKVRLEEATLSFPANCETPIAADLTMRDEHGAQISMSLDFLYTGPPKWEIAVDTGEGSVRLSQGGAVLTVDGDAPITSPDREYPTLYRHFANLVNNRVSDVDAEPLRLVADAFLCGRRIVVDPFTE
jgi:D-galactose 1-dehydrogenase